MKIIDFSHGDSIWPQINDGVMGGLSSGQMVAAEGYATFQGKVSFDNNGGFSSVRSRPVVHDLSAFEGLLPVFKRDFRTVLLDLPPVAESSVWCPLVGALDGVILVIEAERTDGRTALHAKQRLLESGANILGVVFNKRRMHIPGWLYRIL